MQLIDSHVHINFNVFEKDLEAVQKRWQEAGVVHLVHSCVKPDEFASIQSLANRFSEISFAVGLHPLDAAKWRRFDGSSNLSTSKQIRTLATADNRVVAIGEIGLDFYKADNKQQQVMVFTEQLEIAGELNLPVIIHCRDAAVATKEILAKYSSQLSSPPGVMHCWGENPEVTQWFLDLGFYISFSGIVTFKNAKQVQASAAMVESDRLLIETDCPFLSPEPKRKIKRNEPAHVRYVAEYIAKLRQVPIETIANQTTANACKLFRLKGKWGIGNGEW